jgi:hypothetical protein
MFGTKKSIMKDEGKIVVDNNGNEVKPEFLRKTLIVLESLKNQKTFTDAISKI